MSISGSHQISVFAWNCGGSWLTHINDPYIRSFLSSHAVFTIIDPCISTAHLPSVIIPGYTVIPSLRHYSTPFSTRSFGGILSYVSNSFFPHVVVVQDNQSNDLDQLIFRMGDLHFVFVYIPQPQSSVLSRLEVGPWDALCGEVATLQKTKEKFVIMGDFNAHIADRTPSGIYQHRTSTDHRFDTYGSELLNLCAKRCYILNGDSNFEPGGEPTFLCNDNVGSSVIDYCLVSTDVYLHSSSLSFYIHSAIARLDHLPIVVSLRCLFPPPPEVRQELPYAQVAQKARTSGKRNSADSLLKNLMGDSAKIANTEVILPVGPLPDAPSGARLRRDLSRLARSSGFRDDPSMRAEYKLLYAKLHKLRHSKYILSRKSLRDRLLRCQGRRAYWDFVRRVRRSGVDVSTDSSDTLKHFKALLSRASASSPTQQSTFASAVSSSSFSSSLPSSAPRPLRPLPGDPFFYSEDEIVLCLDEPLDPDDVELALKRMKASACGEDKVTVRGLHGIDSEQIAAFFHELSTLDCLPASWSRSILVPIPKVHNPSVSQLRGLSIQTCIRRLYSKCLLPRLERWMEGDCIIPHGQSGFRKGYRTTDNLFILRCIHERCVQDGRELFIGLLDTHKAFDEVDRDRLFLKLHSMGARGSLVNMLRRLYTDTKTVLRLRGRYSSPFGVDKGVLQGDPLSPLLFIIYIAELDTSDRLCDPVLSGIRISDLFLADDIALPSCDPAGFQRKLDSASEQLSEIGLRLNPSKSVWLRLGKTSKNDYSFFAGVGDDRDAMREVQSARYLGFDLVAGSKWDISTYVSRIIGKARAVSTSLFQQRGRLGPVNADFMMRLYHNLVDSYFVYAAEVSFDTSVGQERQLNQILLNHARSAMGLPPNCIRLILLIDNAVLLVSHRRLQLAARYLAYASELPSNRYVAAAMRDSVDLAASAGKGLFWEFTSRLGKIDASLDTSPRRRLGVEVQKALVESLDSAWQILVSGSSRLSIHLMSVSEVSDLRKTAKKLRYTRILSLEGCRAIARLRASAHNLNIERLRRADVPREERFCPVHTDVVETELHAIMYCSDHDVARETFLSRLYTLSPSLSKKTKRQLLLSTILNPPADVAACVGTFLFKVFERVDQRYLRA